MSLKKQSFLPFIAAALLGSAGCELVSAVDRSKIPDNSGGTGGTATGGSGGTSTTTTTTSAGGSGGTGGGTGGTSTTSTTTTTATGGAGGMATGGSGGTGTGGGDAGTPCTTAAQCPAPANECVIATCTAGVCGFSFEPAGTLALNQTGGDCRRNECDGDGDIVNAADNSDTPDDGNACTTDTCSAGSKVFTPKASGSNCGGTQVCNATGQCVGCTQPSDCGVDTTCRTFTCTNNVCGHTDQPAGHIVANTPAGDCRSDQCDGAGNLTTGAVDNNDLPNDNKSCTTDTCNAGAPSHAPVTTGTSCTEVSGGKCDASGTCVACIVAADCGTSTACRAYSCSAAGACSHVDQPSGFVVSNTPAGNCRSDQCDGNGNLTPNAVDNNDKPNDSNSCTTDTCTAGTPSNPSVAPGTSCTEVSGGKCNAGGTCVACLAASDCGTDTACKTFACNSGTCSQNNQPLGHVVTNVPVGNCRSNQCDGAGNLVSDAVDNTDLPNDTNSCTTDTCNAGAPSSTPVTPGTSCTEVSGGKCNAGGTCVACIVAADCGTSNACRAYSCSAAGACSHVDQPAGTLAADPTPGDCHADVCDGGGNITVNAIYNADKPVSDGIDCTDEVCTAGVASHPSSPVGAACNQNGGTVCDGAGNCGTCTLDSQCPAGGACQVAKCTTGTCGFIAAPAADLPAGSQLAGDCQKLTCNGTSQTPVSVADNSDLPTDDGNECTFDTCTAGVVDHGGKPLGTPVAAQTPNDCKTRVCNGSGGQTDEANALDLPLDDGNECTSQTCVGTVPTTTPTAPGSPCTAGGTVCDGAGICVACVHDSDCPTTGAGACQVPVCTTGTCGFGPAPAADLPAGSQVAGNCQKLTCDGLSQTPVSVADNTDVPADDGIECTFDTCTAGAVDHGPRPLGTTCTVGGTACDGAGNCVTPAAPDVAITAPADGGSVSPRSTIAVTFTQAMSTGTLTAQTTAGACSGSIQVSLDDFASCIAFSSATPTFSAGDTIATLTAAPGLLANRKAVADNSLYKIRVTTAAQSATNVALAAQYSSTTGFGTTGLVYEGSVVIAEVFAGGASAGATYKFDYVVLHNRGTTTVDLAGTSLQYAAATGTAWSTTPTQLTGTIAPGGYFLVQLAGTSADPSLPLPTPVNFTATGSQALGMQANNGKIAFVNGIATMAAGACPDPARVIDFVGYGTASCGEGTQLPALTTTTAGTRKHSGCTDTNSNSRDFTIGAPTPKNSDSPAVICGGPLNESDAASEFGYAVTQDPKSISAAAGSSQTVYGRIYEAGVTDVGGEPAGVTAQLGYGPASANPEYEMGWTWIDATYNGACGDCGSNNDEYMATFTAPAAGTYAYVYRFSTDGGLSWTYTDNNGVGANGGLAFSFDQMATMTVTP